MNRLGPRTTTSPRAPSSSSTTRSVTSGSATATRTPHSGRPTVPGRGGSEEVLTVTVGPASVSP